MGKKIRITEAQYNRLQEMLFEVDINTAVKSVIKAGDVLNIGFSNGVKSFKVNKADTESVYMNGITTGTQNNTYYFSPDYLHVNDLVLSYIEKGKEDDAETADPSNWAKDGGTVTNFEIVRNNKVIDTIDLDGKVKPIPPKPPKPEPEQPEQPLDKKDNEEEKPSNDELKDDGLDVAELIKNDETLRNAFYRQPNFWKSFIAGVQGKDPKGSGIITALELVDKYLGSRFLNTFGEAFMQGRIADFIPSENIVIDGQTIIGKGLPAKATVNKTRHGVKLMGKYKDGKDFRNWVVDLDRDDEEEYGDDVYDGKFKFNDNDFTSAKAVKLKFIEGSGYQPHKLKQVKQKNKK
jgi:hypothetical protein